MQYTKITTSKQNVINIQNQKYKLTPTNLQINTPINNVFFKSKRCNGIVIPGPKNNNNKTRGFTFRVNLVILTVGVSNIYTLD
jgi:hypothetical protein